MKETFERIHRGSIDKFEKVVDFSAKTVERIPHLPAKTHLALFIRSKRLHRIFFKYWIPFSIFYKVLLALGLGTWLLTCLEKDLNEEPKSIQPTIVDTPTPKLLPKYSAFPESIYTIRDLHYNALVNGAPNEN